jgi:hypothetical protein
MLVPNDSGFCRSGIYAEVFAEKAGSGTAKLPDSPTALETVIQKEQAHQKLVPVEERCSRKEPSPPFRS